MKLTNTLKPILLLCCLMFSYQAIAQTITLPSQELVETLLEEIEGCNTEIAVTEKAIKKMEESPGYYTLLAYNTAKKYLEGYKDCLNERREELDSLRQGYSGWFNSPNATMSLGRDHDITPRELENKVATIEEIYAALFKRFEALEKPED